MYLNIYYARMSMFLRGEQRSFKIFTNEFNELARVLYYIERKFPFSIFVENILLYVFPNS